MHAITRGRRSGLGTLIRAIGVAAWLVGAAATAAAQDSDQRLRALTADEALTPERIERRRLLERGDLLRQTDPDAAITAYRDAIRLIELDYGIFHPELIEPLMRLGRAQQAAGRIDDALETGGRARHLHRIHYGLHDLGQIEQVRWMSELLQLRGDIEGATGQQEYIFGLQQRAYGESAALVPALRDLAAWYARYGQVALSRERTERAIELLEREQLAESREMIDLLVEYAQQLRMERYPAGGEIETRPAMQFSTGPSRPMFANDPIATGVQINPATTGRKALERAVEIADALPDATLDERARARITLGDWHLMFERWSQAEEAYIDAIEVLDGSTSPLLDIFAEPQAVATAEPAPPPPPDGASPEPYAGWVVIQFDVTEHGRIRDVEVLESVPDGLMDFRTRRALRSSRYRPRFVDGVAVATENVRRRFDFTYYVRAQDPADATAADDS